MSKPLHVTRGETFTERFSSEVDGEPYSQLDRTLLFTLWREWGRPGQAIEFTIESLNSADERLVALETEDDLLVGLWELRLLPTDTLLEPGMYHYTVWSTADADPDDSEALVLPSQFYVGDSGKDD